MGCNCGKPKCDGHCGVSPAVLQINNPSECTLFHRVEVPASMGDSKTNPPKNGAYKNVLLYYEADQTSWLYSSDGIPQKLVNGLTNYEDAINLPQINGVTLLGDKTSSQLGIKDLFYINVTNVDFDEGTFTADKTYAEILEAYNAGKLPIVIVKEEDSSHLYNGIYMLRSYGVNDESDGFDFVYVNATGSEGRVDAGSWAIHIGNGYSRAFESYGSVEIDNALNQYSNHAVSNSVVTNALLSRAVVFNTVADMKTATNLVNGSYARTLGFHSVNDGGGALYKIASTGTANEMDVIAVGNLYAHLVLGNNMNVKQFGAYADNTHDDSAAINLSLSKLNYAYLPNGTYLTNNTITVSAYQKLSGESKLRSIIHYTGNGNCITETGSTDTVKFEISNLTLQGSNKEGCGLYLWRTNRVMPNPGDCYSHVYNICAQGFDTGIFIGRYQNVSKYENIEGNYCNIGIKFDHADDIFADKLLAHGNANHGIWFLSSSNLNMSNLYAYYNGRADDTQYYNFIFNSCSGINISGLTAQESYGDNIWLSYTNNVIIANAYLSWPGLTKATPNQINLIGCNNCSIKATSQNGQYGQHGVSGYNNYVLGLRDNTKNCDVQISVEADFPSSQKINNIGSTQSSNVYNGNIFVISKQGDLKINKVNYLKNGTLANKTDLTAVGNSPFCSWVNGKLRVDMTGQTYGRTINLKVAELPRADVYTTYIHFKKVSGTGIVSFNAPGAVSVNAADNEYWISFTKYMESTTEDQTIPLQVAKELVIDVLEAGICLGESGAFELPLASGAIV